MSIIDEIDAQIAEIASSVRELAPFDDRMALTSFILDNSDAVIDEARKMLPHVKDGGAVEEARIEASRAASVALGLGYR